MFNVTTNNEKNGIEVRFNSKPEQSVLELLKENGFRWSGKQKMWYAKRSDKTVSAVESIGGKIDSVKDKSEKPQRYDLWEMTRTDEIEDNFAKYRIYDVKEIAAIIRKHIRERFPMCKWSVTSERNSIHVELLVSPYAKDSDEVNAIVHYVYKFAQSYNYDNSDSMSDYFDVNFYGVYEHHIVGYDYQQREMTVSEKNISEAFQTSKVAFETAEKERQERELAERIKQDEIDRIESAKREEVRKKEHEEIEAAYAMTSVDYFILDCVDLSDEEMNEHKHNRVNCRVTRDVYLPENIYDMFYKQKIYDFSFIEHMGGSNTDDRRIKSFVDYQHMTDKERDSVEWYEDNCVAVFRGEELKLIINPEGHSYAKYIFVMDEQSRRVEEYHTSYGISEEEYKKNCAAAEEIEKAYKAIISGTDMENSENWDTIDYECFRDYIYDWIEKSHFDFNIGVARAMPEGYMKNIMYRVLTEPVNIQEQFSKAHLKRGQKITVIRINDFGGISVMNTTVDSVEYGKYAQYDRAVKLIHKPQNKRGLYYNHFYNEVIIYDGWVDVPDSLFWETTKSEGGLICRKTIYLSCDRAQYDVVLDYFKQRGVKPIINTYKPVF